MNDEIKSFSLNGFELQKYQQNRYPFLMIDYVTEVIPGISAKGYKNLTNNEWFFPVHFVGAPNMPGGLQIEAFAQMLTVAITTLPEIGESQTTRGLKFLAKFYKEIVPGDRFDIEAEVVSWKRGICQGKAKGYIKGELASEGEISFVVPEVLNNFIPKK